MVVEVGTGMRNLNPAVLSVRVGSDAGPEWESVEVRSVAAEGLIRQHGAEQALDRFLVALQADSEVTILNRHSTLSRGGRP